MRPILFTRTWCFSLLVFSLCSIFSLCSLSGICGDEYKTVFEAPRDGGLTNGWTLNRWEGYKPYVAPRWDGAANALTFDGNVSKYGFGVVGRQLAARSGEVAIFEFDARGSGVFTVGIQCYSGKTWTGIPSNGQNILLSRQWKKYIAAVPVVDLKEKATDRVTPVFGGAQNAKISIRSIVVRVAAGTGEASNDTRRLVLTEPVFSDGYETNKARPGNPRRIEEILTDGVMDRCDWGLYENTNGPIVLARRKIERKGKDSLFAASIRLRSFGRAVPTEGKVSFRMDVGGREITLETTSNADDAGIGLAVLEDGVVVRTATLERGELPVDMLFAVGPDRFRVQLDSIATGKTQSLDGALSLPAGTQSADVQIALDAKEAVVDNVALGIAVVEPVKRSLFALERAVSFDPVKEGWKLVFSDDFNGTELDWTKWFPYQHSKAVKKENVVLDGSGILKIQTRRDATGALTTGSIWTIPKFHYGYFESRLRFTHEPGWWAAFWLYGTSNSNPMFDGFEIDIFEDYYFKRSSVRSIPSMELDHNLHTYLGKTLKSWNYHSKLPGDPRDFYILGCKWTPLEISYYLNGKLIAAKAAHSPYDSLTFDAFHHAMGGDVLLHAILSGQIMGDGYQPARDGKLPEDFEVDYIRVYKMPRDKAPGVEWKEHRPARIIPRGTPLLLDAKVTPNSATKAKIESVSLFDSGFLLETKTREPWTFETAIDYDHYRGTKYMTPGRSRKVPDLDGYPHFFVVVAQDANGEVAFTPARIVIPAEVGASRPYRGVAAKVPGTIMPGHYDEGGQNVAYYDSTPGDGDTNKYRPGEAVDGTEKILWAVASGEWLNYTLAIEHAGRYDITLHFGSTSYSQNDFGFTLLLDGKTIGSLVLPRTDDWTPNTPATLKDVELPAGTHLLTLLCKGAISLGTIEITPHSGITPHK